MAEDSKGSRGALVTTGVLAIVVAGALAVRFAAPPQGPAAPPGPPPANGGNGGGNGPGGVPVPPGPPAPAGGASTPQDEIVPPARAREVSPLLEANALWPQPDALVAVVPGRDRELDQRAAELEVDARRWLSPSAVPLDWMSSLGTDAAGQVYARIGRRGVVTGLVSRNRVKDLYTLGFAVTFPADAKLDTATLVERLKLVVLPHVADEVGRRIRPHATANDGENLGANVRLDPNGAGMVFPYFYLYARPRSLVGVLQTLPRIEVK